MGYNISMAASEGFRIEHDSMGEVQVPADALWGAQTQRAIENFPISGRPIDRRLIRALGLIKAKAAVANVRHEVISAELGTAIHDAALRVAAGDHDDQFPVDVFQTGSGTSSNMNANEVIGRIAGAHPNDEVNASQSSNDVFPTAIHFAAVEAIVTDLLPALNLLETSLNTKAEQFGEVVKAGRTHLMDAVPITLGQEFGGYATQINQGVQRLKDSLGRLGELPIGGTAVGTGLNAPKGFGAEVVKGLVEASGLNLSEARDHIAAQSSRDSLVEASGQLRVLAVSLTKIANDIRWMASGPATGLGEIHLPDLQPGSSIMPGKVNPVLCEAVTQVSAQVIGNDAAIAFSGSQGNFELNVYMPVMARNLLESIELLANVTKLFAERCIDGIEANTEKCRTYAETSPAVATSLNPFLGYERTAELIKSGKPIRELVAATGELSDEELDRALDVLKLALGG